MPQASAHAILLGVRGPYEHERRHRRLPESFFHVGGRWMRGMTVAVKVLSRCQIEGRKGVRFEI
jgi:hypothetical protein